MSAHIWLFDGHCVLCSRAVRYTLRFERKPDIRFVAIQSAQGRSLAKIHDIDPDTPESFIFLEHNIAHQKSAGLFALLKHVGGPAILLRPLSLLPRSWTDWAYLKLAANRYRLLGKTETCPLPAPKHRARFTLPESPK